MQPTLLVHLVLSDWHMSLYLINLTNLVILNIRKYKNIIKLSFNQDDKKLQTDQTKLKRIKNWIYDFK